MITLVVGTEEDSKFFAHKHMLCTASPFFEAACKSEWLEDETIKLLVDNPDAIKASWGVSAQVPIRG